MCLVFIAFVALLATGLVLHSNACGTTLAPVTPAPEEKGCAPGMGCCGYLPPYKRNRQLVYGGNLAAEAGRWPWMAYVSGWYQDGTEIKLFSCGGVIIEREWILTAAHCLWKTENAANYCVVVGRNTHTNLYDVVAKNCAPLGHTPIKIIRHPRFNQSFYDRTMSEANKEASRHDIGLIKIAPLSFDTPDLDSICLGAEEHLYFNKSCYVAGWGRSELALGHTYSAILKTLKSQVWSESDCRTKSSFAKWYDFTDNYYCFGDAHGNVCRGDSGSALMCENPDFEGMYDAAGIASRVFYNGTCAEVLEDGYGEASYFVRIPTHIEWIYDTIGL